MTIVDRIPPTVERTRAELLAALVADRSDPRPFTLDADNRRGELLPSISAAVELGTAYAVTVAADVLAIDADDARHLSALDRLADELHADGWPTLRVASGREGHRHLWAVIPERTARAHWTERADALRLPAPRATMRPPGSPHRTALPVELLDCPESFAVAVEAVRAVPTSDTRVAGYDWRELLRSGRWWRGYRGEGTGSAMIWHVAIGARRAGWTLDQLAAALADESNAGGRTYRARLDLTGKRHASHWLTAYVWPSACRAADRRVTPPADDAEAVAQLDAIAAAVEAQHWRGVAGATDRVVLLALVAAGRREATMTPTLSHRGLAEAARVARRTVSTSTARLGAAGWLLVAELGRGRTIRSDDGTLSERADATRWRLTLPEQVARIFPTGGTPPASTSLNGASSRVLADVGRWRGIGLNGLRVLVALAGGPLTARELAQLLMLNVGNLRARLLPRLAALGVLSRVGNRWALPDDLATALAAASVELGTEGKAVAVAAQHAAERTGYLDHREHTRPVRAARSAARRDADRAARVAARAAAVPTLDLDQLDAASADELDALTTTDALDAADRPGIRPLCAPLSHDLAPSGTEHRPNPPDPPPGHRAHRDARVGIGSAGYEH